MFVKVKLTNIYYDFHQNTLLESHLTIVIVNISIPKVKVAVLKNLVKQYCRLLEGGRVETLFGKILVKIASV